MHDLHDTNARSTSSVFTAARSRAFCAPNFPALAQVRVVPGPIVAVVHVLAKQQVLGVELQGGQHNLRAACEQPAQATRRRSRLGGSTTSSHHLGSRPNCHPLGNMHSLLCTSPTRRAAAQRGDGSARAALSPVLHAEECNAAALEHAPHLACVTHDCCSMRGKQFTSLTESSASLSLRWLRGKFTITASAKFVGTSEEGKMSTATQQMIDNARKQRPDMTEAEDWQKEPSG
jgi:hypothetical protein